MRRLIIGTVVIAMLGVGTNIAIAARPWVPRQPAAPLGQPLVPGSQTYYPKEGGNWLSAVAIGPDSSIVAVGNTTSTGGGARVVKANPDGSEAWSAAFGGPDGTSRFYGVAVAPDNSIIAVGFSETMYGDFPVKYPEQGHEGAVVARVSTDGKLLWSKVFGGRNLDYFTAVALTPDGGAIVVGSTNSPSGDFPDTHDLSVNNTRASDAVMMKLNPDGTTAWATAFGGNGNDSLSSVAVNADGSIVAAGQTSSSNGDFGCTNKDGCGVVAKVAPDGKLLWQHTFDGKSTSKFNGVAVAQDGSIVAIGQQKFSAWSTRLTPSGGVVWTSRFWVSQSDSSELTAVAATTGGFVAIGYRPDGSGISSGNDFRVVSIKANGGILWNVSVGIQTAKNGSVAVSADGSIAATAGDGSISRLTSTGKSG